MKNLLNVSPFLLLLVPVILMVMVTFIISLTPQVDSEIVVRPSQISTLLFKSVLSSLK